MTQGVDLELDHLVREMSGHFRDTLMAARRAAQARAAQRGPIPAGSRAPFTPDRTDADLAARYRLEAMAARWAAADAVRGRDPGTAAAWDERVREAGIEPTDVIRDSADPHPDPVAAGRESGDHGRDLGGDPASELVTEHLAEVYTDQAADRVDSGDRPVPQELSTAELIAASSPEVPTAGRPATEPAAHRTPHRGLGRSTDRSTTQDTGMAR